MYFHHVLGKAEEINRMNKLINLTKGNRVLYVAAILSIAAATFVAMIEPDRKSVV